MTTRETYESFKRRLRYLLDYYRIVQVVTIGLVVALFFCRYKRWHDFRFRTVTLGVLMGWIILWGDSSETHTYLIALSGYMLWYYLQERHTLFDKTLFWAMIVFFGIIPVDLFVPSSVHRFLNGTLFIDVYLYMLAWGKMVWSLWNGQKEGTLTEGLNYKSLANKI